MSIAEAVYSQSNAATGGKAYDIPRSDKPEAKEAYKRKAQPKVCGVSAHQDPIVCSGDVVHKQKSIDIHAAGYARAGQPTLQDMLGEIVNGRDAQAMFAAVDEQGNQLIPLQTWFDDDRLEEEAKEIDDIRVWLEFEKAMWRGPITDIKIAEGWNLHTASGYIVKMRHLVRLALIELCYPFCVRTTDEDEADEPGRRMWRKGVRPYEFLGCTRGEWRVRGTKQGRFQDYYDRVYNELLKLSSGAISHVKERVDNVSKKW